MSESEKIAKELTKGELDLIHRILIKHTAGFLDEVRAAIRKKNKRIKKLENAINLCLAELDGENSIDADTTLHRALREALK